MTVNEAIKVLKRLSTDNVCVGNEHTAVDMAIQALEENQQYHAIGTVEELQALKEKAEPKKPISNPTDDTCLYYENYCPHCEILLFVKYKYCPKCGTKLDWS